MNREKTQQLALQTVRALPFTRAVSLTGSYAEGRASKASDIDFFIRIEPGHLWTGRFVVTALLRLLNIARTDTKIAGRICLNWFATFDAPAKQQGRVYELLWQEKSPTGFKRFMEQMLTGSAGVRLEQYLKNYQIGRIERDPRSHVPGTQVRYSDSELGFHPPKQR